MLSDNSENLVQIHTQRDTWSGADATVTSVDRKTNVRLNSRQQNELINIFNGFVDHLEKYCKGEVAAGPPPKKKIR